MALQRAYKEDDIRNELIKTNEWEEDLFDVINWNAFGTLFRAMTLCDRIKFFKMAHGICSQS